MQISKEEKYLNHLILHSCDVTTVGLFDGQMGIVLALSHYAHVYKNKTAQEVSEYLLDKVMLNLTKDMRISFSNGLTGIGWGIEYLLQNHYMKGDSAEICEVIDQRLMELNPTRLNDLSLESGLEGYLHYIIAHNISTSNTSFCDDFNHELATRLKQIKENPLGYSTTLFNLIDLYHATLNNEGSYEFTLSNFYKGNRSKPEMKKFGLRSGVAGYMETVIMR